VATKNKKTAKRKNRRPIMTNRPYRTELPDLAFSESDWIEKREQPNISLQLPGLINFLKEHLVTEENSVRLFITALNTTAYSDIREMLESFLMDSRQHTSLILSSIRKLGGNPSESYTGGDYQLERARNLLKNARHEITGPHILEELVLNETHNRHDWLILSRMIPFIPEARYRIIVQDLVNRIEYRKTMQLDWLTNALIRHRSQLLIQPAEISKAA
jgi:hypothetical protein